MKLLTSAFFLLSATLSDAIATVKRQSTGGGPFAPAGYITDDSLPTHTIYRPENPGGDPMPVFVWSNGACFADGTAVQNFLAHIASYGFVVLSAGLPGGSGSSSVEMMNQAVEWAANGANGLINVDTGRIMAAGASCGGTEAYEMNSNPFVSSLGIFNSGLLGNEDFAAQITKPIIYVLGGPDDIAYANGERDYANLPTSLAAWKGNVNSVGHTGTYYEENGGLFAEAAALWLSFIFKGETEAGAYFEDGAAVAYGWSDATSRNIGNLSVPIGV